MKKNMGMVDKVVRVVVAAVIVVLYFMEIVSGTLGVVLLVLAAVFVVTSLVGFCPLYTLFVMSTNKSEEKMTEEKPMEEKKEA